VTRIPVWFQPRDYQLPVWNAFVEEQSHRRGALVWPRRAGKDITCFNIMVYHALVVRPGNYYYFAPTYTQGEKIIWDGKIKDGRPFLSCIPGFPNTIKDDPNSVIAHIDQRKMKIKLTNGSLIQIVGAAEEDNVVGTNPVGCVFSEYSIQSPKFWDYMRPILVENGGWALFTYTARGLNHGWRLYETTKNHPDWHTEFHTAKTVVHNGQRIITDDVIQAEIDAGMPEETAQQEFFNDFYASNTGAYYAVEMRKVQDEGRIGEVPWQPNLPVHTVWDIGMNDNTAIWFFQVDPVGNVNIIDSYQNNNQGMPEYIRQLKRKPYTYGSHYAPHDIKVKEFGTGVSRIETAFNHGLRFQLVPNISKMDGIDAARFALRKCRFDSKKCFEGLEALRQYSKKDTGMVDMAGRPIYSGECQKDWTNHFADAFRYLALVIDHVSCDNVDINGDVTHLPERAIGDWDELEM
jgi:phage terminase large subunit